MQRFKNILVVSSDTIGDDDALVQATTLANRNAARLTLIEVVDDPACSASRRVERRKRLERIAASIQHEGVHVEAHVHIGTPFLNIVQQVLRADHDLVVMSAEQSLGLKALFFGSTSMHLMRKCPCPVWIVKPGQQARYKQILAAVDPAPANDFADDDLNVKILDLATSLARLTKSQLHIAHAWELSGNDLNTIRSETTEDMRSNLIRKNEQVHRERLDGLLARYALDDLQHDIHVVRGDPMNLLPRMTREKSVDILVMGTVRRTGVAGLLIGNTAEIVLRQVECAVLTVKPEGFVTPVTLEELPVPFEGERWPVSKPTEHGLEPSPTLVDVRDSSSTIHSRAHSARVR